MAGRRLQRTFNSYGEIFPVVLLNYRAVTALTVLRILHQINCATARILLELPVARKVLVCFYY